MKSAAGSQSVPPPFPTLREPTREVRNTNSAVIPGGPTPIQGVGTQIRPPIHRQPRVTLSTNERVQKLTDKLAEVKARLLQRGLRGGAVPRDIVANIQDAVTQNGGKGVSQLDYWQNLVKVASNDRIAEAVLAGHLTPTDLASRRREELEQISADLTALSESDFTLKVWGRHNNLDVCNTFNDPLHRPTDQS
jgi:hypothetical protein